MLDAFCYLIAVLLSTSGIFAFHMFVVFLLKGHMFLVFLLKGHIFLVDIDTQWEYPFILISQNGYEKSSLFHYIETFTKRKKINKKLGSFHFCLRETSISKYKIMLLMHVYVFIFRSSNTKLHPADCLWCCSTGLRESNSSYWCNSCCKAGNPFVWVLMFHKSPSIFVYTSKTIFLLFWQFNVLRMAIVLDIFVSH